MAPTMLDKETTKPAAADLRAAIEAIVSRLEPDQIILFGSAARGEMTHDSDLDLLVIKNGGSDADALHIGRSCGRNGIEMDVIVTSGATAEASRPYAGDVKGHALETGRTIYAKKDFEPIATGPTLARVGGRMVQRTLYKPDHAGRFLARAERKWGIATTTKLHPADRCENLQAAMEQALKGLIVAQGRHVEHRHDLNRLWDEAERDGERIAASRDPKALDTLSLYAGKYQYDDPVDGTPEKTWNATRTTGEDVMEHARSRIPTLVDETTDRLKAQL